MVELLGLLLFTIVTFWVLPLVLNHIRVAWISDYLRKWVMFLFVFYTCCCLGWITHHNPEVMEAVMKWQKEWNLFLGYIIIGALGAFIFCGYWWFAGKISIPQALSKDTIAHYRSEFSQLQDSQKEALQKMLITMNANDVPDSDWQILEKAGFVERNFTGKIGIKKELNQLVAQLLKEKIDDKQPAKPPTAEEIAKEVAKRMPAQKTAPPQNPLAKNETEKATKGAMDKPYFVLASMPEIKTSPQVRFTIRIRNAGNHVAVNLRIREITVDHQFEVKPCFYDSSEANEIAPNTIISHWTNLKVPSDYMIPQYWIYAIKYEDKEALVPKKVSQIWYFKTTERWTGINDGTPPPHFSTVAASEKEGIISHLRQELKDYFE